MSFKEWLRLHEIGTGTNAVAVVRSPMLMVRRGVFNRKKEPPLLTMRFNSGKPGNST